MTLEFARLGPEMFFQFAAVQFFIEWNLTCLWRSADSAAHALLGLPKFGGRMAVRSFRPDSAPLWMPRSSGWFERHFDLRAKTQDPRFRFESRPALSVGPESSIKVNPNWFTATEREGTLRLENVLVAQQRHFAWIGRCRGKRELSGLGEKISWTQGKGRERGLGGTYVFVKISSSLGALHLTALIHFLPFFSLIEIQMKILYVRKILLVFKNVD